MSNNREPTPPIAVDYDPFADASALARVVPATEAQREIWLACQLGGDATLAYNESISLRLRGALDPARLQAAMQSLADRHDALRATLGADGQYLFIADRLTLTVPLATVDAVTSAQRVDAIRQIAQEQVNTPFDLERGPLLRAQIVQFDPAESVLILTAHHIICDGWSFGVLVNELAQLCAAADGADQTSITSYGDYALALHDAEHTATAEGDLRYWLSVYADAVPQLDLPTDRPRSSVRSFAAAREDYRLSAATLEAVRKLAKRQGASLFVTLYAVYAGLIARLSGQSDVVVGISAAAQAAEGLPSLVGHCVSLLPIRLKTNLDASVADLIAQARGAMLDAQDHQGLSFGALLKHLQFERQPGRMPLVPVLFNLDSRIDPAIFAAAGLQAELTSNPRGAENFELYLNATPDPDGLLLECQYKTELFDQATVRRWLALFEEALQRAAATPDMSLAEALAPTVTEQALLRQWNDTARPYPAGQRLSDLLAASLRQHADAQALVFEGQALSYAELDRRARRLALELRSRGAGPGQRVGLYLPRSLDLIVALVGIIYSGGAYVPLDPDLPAERLAGMAEDAALALLITQATLHKRIATTLPAACETLFIDNTESTVDDTDTDAMPSVDLLGTAADPAYVIFTSGSTGRPKGAINAHRGIVNRLLWMQARYQLQPGERVLQKTPFSFDVSVWEFFWPLVTGATMVIARPDGHRDSAYLAELVQRERVDVMHFVPSMLRFFLEEPAAASCNGLRQVLCSGEALAPDLVEKFFHLLPNTRLANLYGPTEAAVDVSAWDCQPGAQSGTVPIGAPIANTRLHVLDHTLRPLPIGVAGDLYIGGVQVGLGYVARPELTAERFIVDPFDADGRLYKTGDIARWRADGALEYLGRSDHQVKLRGYRIELGEIETRLLAADGVANAVAVTREDVPGDIRLVAYVVGRSGAVDVDALRERLRQQLPDFMVPQSIMALERIPLLSSGKLDRRALPAPSTLRSAGPMARVAPRNDVEAAVLAAMEEVLRLPSLSIHDDFFGLGGHSLLAAKLIARLNQTLDLQMPLRAVFEAPSAEKLAGVAQRSRSDGGPRRPPIQHQPDHRAAPLTTQQERIAFLEELHPGRVTYNAPSAHRLAGRMDIPAFTRAFAEVVQRQPILRTMIVTLDGVHVQRVVDGVEMALQVEDLSSLADAAREVELTRRMRSIIDTPIDIRQAPLWRAALYRLADDEHVFLFMPHHIIWDGWSFDLLYSELAAALGGDGSTTPSRLPPLPVSYADYADWQAQWIHSPTFKQLLKDWNRRVEKQEPPQALGTDRPRGPGMSGLGATELVSIDRATTERLRQLARDANLTLNMLTMALYGAMMADLAGHNSIIVGMPVRARLTIEVEPVMGFFNNLLTLHLDIERSHSLATYFAGFKRSLLDLLQYEDVPFECLVEETQARSRSPQAGLYQVLFSFQDARERERQWGPLRQTNIPIFQQGATEDLGLWLMETPQGLEGGFTYNADIYTEQTARHLHSCYLALLQRAVAEPQQTLGSLLNNIDADGRHALRNLAVAPATHAPLGTAVRTDGHDAAQRALTPTEQTMIDIWAPLLGLEPGQITPQDNYFDLGGDSLSTRRVMAGMHAITGKSIRTQAFVLESLEQLARAYDQATPQSTSKAGLMRRLLGRLSRNDDTGANR